MRACLCNDVVRVRARLSKYVVAMRRRLRYYVITMCIRLRDTMRERGVISMRMRRYAARSARINARRPAFDKLTT
jgi:rRNA-processing protein FCF1